MPPVFSKLWNSVMFDDMLDQFGNTEPGVTRILRTNVVNSFTTKVVNGVTVYFYEGRPADAMTDPEWYKEAIPNTMLEEVTNATSGQMTFVRKLSYEATGNPSDILNQDHFIALVVKKAIDDNKTLHLDWIPTAVEKAWTVLYPHEELQKDIRSWAYFVVCRAIVDHFDSME
jgi:hypothetical protein